MSSVTEGSFSSGANIEEEDAHHQGQALHGFPSAAGAAFNHSTTAGMLELPTAKKRNLPGTPDPEAEVIALSPGTLMATNRFVCEICDKGFQREQNLQLHRRGHNLPWKLRQRSAAEGGGKRRRVYVCPEATCVHHSPGRALGDLTGIKKHYCRKHGEKKWKCERCSKRYAVQSDWKAHSKTCGTKEYKCDCGTVFSRRDSFITHRAFCDALAQENSHFAQHCTTANANLATPLSHDGIAAASFSVDCDAGIPPPKALSDFSVSAALAFPSITLPTARAPSGYGPMAFDSSVGHTIAPSSMNTSATALLQKASQIGATGSSDGVPRPVTMMAGPDRAAVAGPFGRVDPAWPFCGDELMREVTVDFFGMEGGGEEEARRRLMEIGGGGGGGHRMGMELLQRFGQGLAAHGPKFDG